MEKKIKFTGFPWYHDPHKQPYYRFLADRYDLLECDDPDYVIDGGQSFEHVKYDAVKILICSENDVPDFNAYDYAVASSFLDFGDRYYRMPWYAFSPIPEIGFARPSAEDLGLLQRGFCSFVVSNSEFADPMRRKFYEALSRYKKVDSGGTYLNNIGEAVKDKLSFCRRYKFNIAFENSACDGYVTEKIVDAYAAESIPIYYGCSKVGLDFNEESLIRVRDESEIPRAVEEIIRLDNDDDAYMKMLSQPCFVEGRVNQYKKGLNNFLQNIFDPPLNEACRLYKYGHQAMMRRHLGYMHGLDYKIGKSWAYRTAIGIVGRIRSARK